MRFDKLKKGDTFYYDNMWFVKIHTIQGYNTCCITMGDLRFCEQDLDVDPSIETKTKRNIVFFKDLSIGEHFVESTTNHKYMKLNVPSKAVNLSNGHIKGFDDTEEVKLFKTGIFKND